MAKSLQLGSIAGIKLQVHWSFSLIVAWVLTTSLLAGQGILGSLSSVVFILVLFGCVVLHELGHALAARMYGISTRDITLLPIGGVARLERMPRKPSQELVVALAGPAVNVVIAAVLFLLLAPAVGLSNFLPLQSGTFLQRLMFVNIALVAFNLLPAFPMDGGRVLRALLAMVMSYGRATRVAAIVGQVCALGLGLLAFYNPMLLLIAAFIFFGAAAESNQVAIREQIGGFHVRDGMLRTFRAVPASAHLRDIVLDLLETPQRDFPVIESEQLVGMLRVDDALEALQSRTATTVGQVMIRDIRHVDEDDLLSQTFEASGGRATTLPVTSDGALIGLLDFRRVFELLKARSDLRTQTYYATAVDEPAVANLT